MTESKGVRDPVIPAVSSPRSADAFPVFPEFDLIVGGVPRFAAESAWAWRLARRYARALPARRRVELPGVRPTRGDAAGESAFVLVQADPEAYLPRIAAEWLLDTLARGGADAVVAVSNEPESEDARRNPPFPYHTPSLLEEAAQAMAAATEVARTASGAAASVYAVRRSALDSFPADLPLDEVVRRIAERGGPVLVEPRAYVHRYGVMDGQARDDLASRIPAGAVRVLDVGCSHGATAPSLRTAGVSEIVGIEPDAGDAAEAARVYDRVLPIPLEAVQEEFPGRFDAVLFGDVLEHLDDPAAALTRVRPWLTERGAVVASVPNVGHWSVISDLIEGRFDYVPYSILSGTHVRFFTRATLTDLFEACAFAPPSIDVVRFAPSPRGTDMLARLAAIPGASPDLDVVEFLATAGRARAPSPFMIDRR